MQNGKLYSGHVYSDTNSSSLSLKGSTDEIGHYTCHWKNSLGQAKLKTFDVTYFDHIIQKSPETIAIVVSTALAILLLISVIVGVQMYLKKVSNHWT